MKLQFSGSCVIKSRQLHLPVHRIKVTSLSMKPQFLGSCVIKSRQLRSKDRLCRTGWRKRKGKRVSRQYTMEASSYKSLRSIKDSSHSWKHRKKKRHRITSSKSVSDQRSPLKETVTWKRRKKQRCSRKWLYDVSLRKVCAWKWRKKKRCCSRKWLFSIFDWNPGAVLKESPVQALSSFQVPAFASPKGKECNKWFFKRTCDFKCSFINALCSYNVPFKICF